MTKMLLWLLFVSTVSALPPRPKHIPRYIFGRPYGGFMNQMDFSSRENAAGIYDCNNSSYFEGFVSQPVDHFASNSYNWTQFYQYNNKFHNNASNLVFFMLGGEAAIDVKWVCKDDFPYLKWAKKYGASVFQAEHRYFGRSRPTPTLTVANLKWLTPEQTLADFNNFIEQMNAKYFPKKQMRWVLFGGSYAGTVASWMRVAYPNSSIGCVSSSSAVNLVVDNYNFAVNMKKNYARISDVCTMNIAEAFKEIHSLSYSKSGRIVLENIFDLCTEFPSTIRPIDLQYFWANLFTIFVHLNQYSGNRGNSTEYGMPLACEIMNDESEPNLVIRIRKIINWVHRLTADTGNCMPNVYEDFIAELANVNYDETGDVAAMRLWMHQCCTYLGYFQTTDGGRKNDFWGSLLPVDFYVNQCIDMFSLQLKLGFTHAQVEKYRDMFGGAKHYKGSKIVFTNGNMDPWISLGLLKDNENQANQVFATIIDGGFHGSDMLPDHAQDSASLTAARAFVASKLDSFIRSG